MHGYSYTFWLATVLCVYCFIGAKYGVHAVEKDRWCFRFTWLGPSWDNASLTGNTTCGDLKGSPQPCTGPLVITHDSSPPNTTFLWQMYDTPVIACKLLRGEVCIKWASYYDNNLENITYMCGKVTDEDGSVTSGCESMDKGAYTTTVCACTDYFGIPCNSVPVLTPVWLLTVLSIAVITMTSLVTTAAGT